MSTTTLRDILGRPIFSQQREKMGYVVDVIEEPSDGHLEGFIYQTGIFSGKRLVVPAIEVSRIGEQITLFGSISTTPVFEKKRMRYFEGNRVETLSGIYLGRVSNYSFDVASFVIQELFVKQRLFGIVPFRSYLISRHQIIDVREDAIIVRDAVVTTEEFVKQENPAEAEVAAGFQSSSQGD